MREDFDRLQKQLTKRAEREKTAQENIIYAMEERKAKAADRATKGEAALEKVKRHQRMLERQSVKSYKASIEEQENRLKQKFDDENMRARNGKKEVIQREKAIKARHDREDDSID